jgi:hypothetical protein
MNSMISNPLHYPRWVRLTPESEPILVQNHQHHSALAGVEYDADANLVVRQPEAAPEPPIAPREPQMVSGLLSIEEEERQIAEAAGERVEPVVDAAYIPTPAEQEDGLESGRFVPVDEEDLSAMFPPKAAKE